MSADTAKLVAQAREWEKHDGRGLLGTLAAALEAAEAQMIENGDNYADAVTQNRILLDQNRILLDRAEALAGLLGELDAFTGRDWYYARTGLQDEVRDALAAVEPPEEPRTFGDQLPYRSGNPLPAVEPPEAKT